MSDGTMDRRAFLEQATVGCGVLAGPRRLPGLAPGVSGPTGQLAGQLAAPFELEEITIAGLQAGPPRARRPATATTKTQTSTLTTPATTQVAVYCNKITT